MTVFSLLSWIVVGAVLGSILAALWKIRGLTLGWGFGAGGAGGVVGGLLGAMTIPPGFFAEGLSLVTAMLGSVLALWVARLRLAKENVSAPRR